MSMNDGRGYHTGSQPESRPEIDVNFGAVIRNGTPTTFRINKRKHVVRVGCTDVSFAAIEHIYKVVAPYMKDSGDEVVVQP